MPDEAMEADSDGGCGELGPPWTSFTQFRPTEHDLTEHRPTEDHGNISPVSKPRLSPLRRHHLNVRRGAQHQQELHGHEDEVVALLSKDRGFVWGRGGQTAGMRNTR